MKWLILGGTADARHLVGALADAGLLAPAGPLSLVYSVAGLVRIPKLDCEVISGGFTQFGGLKNYLQDQQISGVFDVTHPFAANMSRTAVEVCAELDLPCWRFHRPAWQPQPGDHWQSFTDWQVLPGLLAGKRNILLTAGQLTEDISAQLLAQAKAEGQRLILRTAAPPRFSWPDDQIWIKAIGPFDLAAEAALFDQYQIDALVTKNSGGDATVAKLAAARNCGAEVFMLQRPDMPAARQEFSNIADCVTALRSYLAI
ncbi:precorrin-6A/cobalt-precorrin-6A reductase [Aliamphritea spongicola]|uniref:precorrin-6A/cobalt-precorrin-6A reductase n=1 Tax=Aliamphritea spongicola TaxID=707589 RepID=UPI00196B9FA3|nr:precorrin-6A/cobalt-precorrin-6A reductase [Aliamphritea spongicola]